MPNYKSNQKLWTIKKDPNGYYYELKLAGVIMDKFYLSTESEALYVSLGVIKK